MSFYGYTPIAPDYSYVAKAGEAFGKAAGGVVDAVGDWKQMKDLKGEVERKQIAIEEMLKNAGYKEDAAKDAARRQVMILPGDSPKEARARFETSWPKALEFAEGEQKKYRSGQSAKDYRSWVSGGQYSNLAASRGGGYTGAAGAVGKSSLDGNNLLGVSGQDQPLSARLYTLPQIAGNAQQPQADGAPGAQSGATAEEFVPYGQRVRDQWAEGYFGRGAGGNQALLSTPDTIPEVGKFTVLDRIKNINDRVISREMTAEDAKLLLGELESEAADEKSRRELAAALAKVEQQQRHDMDIEKYKQEQQTERNNATNASRERAAAKRGGGRGRDKGITENSAINNAKAELSALKALKKEIRQYRTTANTAIANYAPDVPRRADAKKNMGELIEQYIEDSAKYAKTVAEYKKMFPGININDYEHDEEKIRKMFGLDK